jgi:hypothetical protein
MNQHANMMFFCRASFRIPMKMGVEPDLIFCPLMTVVMNSEQKNRRISN